MKKVIVIKLLFVLLVRPSVNYGQDSICPVNRPVNLIGVNLLGNASLVSINYERLFLNRPYFFLSENVGMGINREFSLFGKYAHLYGTISNTLTANVGKNYCYLEIGGGVTMLANNKEIFGFAYPIVGFRIHPFNKKRAFFKIYHQFPIKLGALEKDTEFEMLFFNRVTFIPIGAQIGIAL